MRRSAVHPPRGGEQQLLATTVLRDDGASSRGGGAAVRHASSLLYVRFIPACAGNRPSRCRRSRPSSVHPRVCGEQHQAPANPICRAGSSPRVRGDRKSTRLKLQSLMRTSYAVFCLKKKKHFQQTQTTLDNGTTPIAHYHI